MPRGAGASAGDRCPACGQPSDPDATLRPGPPPGGPPVHLAADLPPRLPVALLVLLATSCAVMGLVLGVWLSGRRPAPSPQAGLSLPALPPPGPALGQPFPPALYPAPAHRTEPPPLPPARVTPPGPGGAAFGPVLPPRPFGQGGREAAAPAPRPGPDHPSGAAPFRGEGAPTLRPIAPPLSAPGMATVRISNPSAGPVDVSLSGQKGETAVVGPHASIDLLIAPGRYDIALRGAARTQRFYDAPLAAADVLTLVYSEGPARRDRAVTGE